MSRMPATRSSPAPTDDERSRRDPDDRRRDPGRHPEVERFGRGDAAGPAQHEGADVQEQRHGRVQHGLPPRRRQHRLGRAAHRLSPSSNRAARCDLVAPVYELRLMHLADFLDFDAIKTGLSGRQQAVADAAAADLAGAAARRSSRRRSWPASTSASSSARPASARASPFRTARSRA